jgi:hypothetical protein
MQRHFRLVHGHVRAGNDLLLEHQRRMLLHAQRVRHVLPLCVYRDLPGSTYVIISAALRSAAVAGNAMLCTFCHFDRDYVAEGPGVSICALCIAEFGSMERKAEGEGPCSFCGKRERPSRFAFRNRKIVATSSAGEARICSRCLPIARVVVAHNAQDSRRNR